jgi:hypothetical protein
VTDAQRNELQALLVRASVAEASRQAARTRGDELAERALEAELRELWQRHSELESAA